VEEYCRERGNSVNPSKFYNHYEANGWIRGKTRMKNWKAAVLVWEDKDKPDPKPATQTEFQKTHAGLSETEWAKLPEYKQMQIIEAQAEAKC
jgi:hypothetical protein